MSEDFYHKEYYRMKKENELLRSQVEGWRSSLETISDPLLIKVDGIGTDRLLKLVNRMASIAKDALVQHPSTERGDGV